MQVNTKKEADVKNNNIPDLASLISKYIAHWPLYIMLGVGGLLLGLVYLYYAAPVYEIDAKILIKDEKKGANDNKAIEDLSLLNTKKITDNEVEVVHSKTFIAAVVKNLSLYAPISDGAKWPYRSAYVTSPVKIEVENPESLTPTEDKVYFKFNSKDSTITLDSTKLPLNKWVKTNYGVLRFSPNKYHLEKYSDTLFFDLINPKLVVTTIHDALDVSSTSKLSTIIELVYKDNVPQRGEDIVNSILSAYDSSSIYDKNVLGANTIAFIDQRLKFIASNLDSIERAIQAYKDNNAAVDVTTQGQLYLKSINDNDQKLSELEMQSASLNQIENYVTNKNSNNKGLIVPLNFGGANDPTLDHLISELYEANFQYEKLSTTMGQNNPQVLALKQQINKIKPGILENLSVQRQKIEESKKSLAQTNTGYSSSLNTIPKKERAIVDMQREQDIRNDIYVLLLTKKEETALAYSATVSDSKIFEPAESSVKPVKPKPLIVIIGGLMFGIFIGLAYVTAKETFNSKILYRKEIEELTQNPVIGEVAYVKPKAPIVIGNEQDTILAEQFRRLGNSLGYLGMGGQRKLLLVTSSISGEGKSFIVASLGANLALAGKKVVLVDFDLHNPSLSSKFDLNEELGVTDFLQGKMKIEQIVKHLDAENNLFIIPRGTECTNYGNLLNSPKIPILFECLTNSFDMVIVDASPIGEVSDASVLAKYCDSTLYVVRHRFTPKNLLQRVDEDNKLNGLKNIGIVFNGIHPRGFGKGKYNAYGYGYYGKVKAKAKTKKKLISRRRRKDLPITTA